MGTTTSRRRHPSGSTPGDAGAQGEDGAAAADLAESTGPDGRRLRRRGRQRRLRFRERWQSGQAARNRAQARAPGSAMWSVEIATGLTTGWGCFCRSSSAWCLFAGGGVRRHPPPRRLARHGVIPRRALVAVALTRRRSRSAPPPRPPRRWRSASPTGSTAARMRTLARSGSKKSRKAGASIARIDAFWRAIAPTQPLSPTNPNDIAYKWGTLDAAVADANAAGLDPLLTVSLAPNWAEGPGRPRRTLHPAPGSPTTRPSATSRAPWPPGTEARSATTRPGTSRTSIRSSTPSTRARTRWAPTSTAGFSTRSTRASTRSTRPRR